MADSDQIWCAFKDQTAMHITQVTGGMHLHVRACARKDVPPFPYLGDGWTDCAEIWYVISDPLARFLPKLRVVHSCKASYWL